MYRKHGVTVLSRRLFNLTSKGGKAFFEAEQAEAFGDVSFHLRAVPPRYFQV